MAQTELSAQVAGWQPIDTAPPDESILIYTAKWGAIVAERSSEFDEWLSRMQCPVSLQEPDEQPTHWMRMPAPPAELDGAAAQIELALPAG